VTIRNPKDFWSGLLFLAVGGAAVLLAQKYPLGTAFKMGPGYFPTALGALLALVGLLAVVRSFIRPGTALEPFHWRLLLIVTGSTVLFGLLVRGAGSSVAVPVMVLATAAASVYFRWRTALILAAGLTVLSALLFVKGLGLPIPLIGPWFGG
jgi:putative tricarboxylic transport membrane protein